MKLSPKAASLQTTDCGRVESLYLGRMTLLRGIKSFVLSSIAGYFFDRRDLEKARKWMDRSVAADPAVDAYAVATDAIMHVLEGRGSAHAHRFTDCLELIDRPRFPNHEYLKIFCEFWLKVLDDHALPNNLEALATEAAGLPTEKWLKRRFRFPSEESIQKYAVKASSDSVIVTYDF